MSDERQHTQAPEQGQSPTAEDLAKQLEQLKQTNSRLLEESKKYKEKARSYESEVERATEESISKEKDLSKVLETERKKLEKLLNENKGMKQKTLQANIQNTVARFAGEVNDIEDLLNQPKYGEILKRGIDTDSLTLDEEVAKEYVEAVLKAKPYLRKQPEATTVMTKKPGYDASTGKIKSVDKMDQKEIEETLFRLYGTK
jgi:hypothetical protein